VREAVASVNAAQQNALGGIAGGLGGLLGG
jgi:hypothetical protein